MPLLPPLPNAFTWRMLFAFGVLSALLGIAQGFTIHPRALLVAGAILAVMLTIAHVYSYWRPRPQFSYPAMLLTYFVVSGLVFGPLSYFTAALGGQLIDPHLAAFDRFIGFDWRAMQRYTAESEILSRLGGAIYHNSGFQIIVAWAVLGLTGQIGRLNAFLTAMVASTAICLFFATAFPAAGAYVYYAVPASEMGFLKGTDAGVWHMTDFEALRAGTMRMIDLSKLEGLVTFPSFHTVVALLCGWSLARTRYIGIPACLYSGLVVLTVLPIGGHYLFDVIFAGVITAACVTLGNWANRTSLAAQASADPATVRA